MPRGWPDTCWLAPRRASGRDARNRRLHFRKAGPPAPRQARFTRVAPESPLRSARPRASISSIFRLRDRPCGARLVGRLRGGPASKSERAGRGSARECGPAVSGRPDARSASAEGYGGPAAAQRAKAGIHPRACRARNGAGYWGPASAGRLAGCRGPRLPSNAGGGFERHSPGGLAASTQPPRSWRAGASLENEGLIVQDDEWS
jgi:hypothetical protein